MMLALVALFGFGFASSASADVTIDDLLAQIAQLQAQLLALNGGEPVPPTPSTDVSSGSLGNYLSLPGFDFSYNTYDRGEETFFYANMSNVDRIAGASVSFGINKLDPTTGWVSANFSGIVGKPANAMEHQYQSMDVDRHGASYQSNVNLGSHQDILKWVPGENEEDPWTPIYGDWMSDAGISVTLTDITPTFANSYYDEWKDDFGKIHFYANVNWNFVSDGVSPAFSTSMSVPEPATMVFLGLGAMSVIVRRRRRRS